MTTLTIGGLQAGFLAIRGRIEEHARRVFSFVRCPSKRADCVAETVAICWRWYCRLAKQGKDARAFPVVLANYATRQIKCGRSVCGQEKAKDVMSASTQKKHGFTVQEFPDTNDATTPHWCEALHDNTQSPVPEAAAFRIDFPRWLRGLGERNRRMVERMAIGERTMDLADEFGVTRGRVSQIREQCHREWQRFHGELAA